MNHGSYVGMMQKKNMAAYTLELTAFSRKTHFQYILEF